MSGVSSLLSASRSGLKSDHSRPLAESSLPSTQSSSFLTDPSRSAAPSTHTADESEFDDSDGSVNESNQKSFLRPTSSGSSYGVQTSLNGSPSKAPPSTSNLASPVSQRDQSHDFQNSSFMNDTKAQFDIAIDLDDGRSAQNARKLSSWLQSSEQRKFSGIRKASTLSKYGMSSTVDASAVQKHDELVKQLTDCKIQLKLYDKFLQDLIDKKQIDVNEITGFHEAWEQNEETVNRLRQEHEEMTSLVEDLYANLEEYQSKWQQADRRADDLQATLSDLRESVSELISTAGIPEKLIQSHDAASYISSALPLLRPLLATEESSKVREELESKIRIYEKEARHAESLLNRQLEEIASWKSRYSDLQVQLDELQEAANTTPPGVKQDVEERLLKYEAMIDDLQRQINQRDETTRQGSITETEASRSLQNAEIAQRNYEELHQIHEDLKAELKNTQQKTAATIKSLTNQLENRTKEQLALRDQVALMDEIKHKLEAAVAKQRTLQSEKTKLSYQVRELNEEKAKLQNNIDVLKAKLDEAQQIGEGAQQKDEVHEQEESGLGSSSFAEMAKDHFERIYRFDFQQLSKLGETFDRLVDDASIKDSLEKISTINEFLEKSDACILDYSEEVVNDLLQCHNSLFRYFIKATDLSVEDHISLLLKKEQRAKENDRHIENLTDRIRELEVQNDQLVKQEETERAPPEFTLRIQELTSRWKAEREARVYENRQAKRRFMELEDEISRLRDVIGTMNVIEDVTESSI